jgi:rubrerythrin
LIVTYCAAQSPHDQNYFSKPQEMVKGIVRPPALELANRDLIESHLHAIWLAESQQNLQEDIPHVLDLANAELEVKNEIKVNLTAQELAPKAAVSMRRVLDSVGDELNEEKAPWAAQKDEFVKGVAAQSYERFSKAFGRWRQLYQSAHTQLTEANRKSEMHGLSATERNEAKQAQIQAQDQLALLAKGSDTGSSDFSTYRYLATEGFLPGYNFPRLPIYAYIPAVGAGAKAAYLQRARFLAIAEFGPRSLIYHEGRVFRVNRAKLPPSARTANGTRLATRSMFVCDDCGAAHEPEPERCTVCGASMDAANAIRNIVRIDNVETQAAERITANDEDRQRQGFDIQTVFAWVMRDARPDVSSALARDAEGDILRIDYAAGATISRVNKGLRRRKDKTVLGFKIDPVSGRWTGGGSDADGDGDDQTPDEPTAQLIVPIVTDSKNAALLRLVTKLQSEAAMPTLQHALSRGLDTVFQLEEGETLTEPVPTREARKAILAYEATEGGAGVLSRLVTEPQALAEVAKAALELMHYENLDEAIAAGDEDKLESNKDAKCVKGCYRCLLSYYNQTDHELIDRTDKEALRILVRLARAEMTSVPAAAVEWDEQFKQWGLPCPDAKPLEVEGQAYPLVWRSHLAVGSEEELSSQQTAALEQLGYSVAKVDLSSKGAPAELAKLLGGGK